MTAYGRAAGLVDRLATWQRRLRQPGAGVPALGDAPAGAFWGGLTADLGVVMQILNLREFGEWLRTNGPAEHREFAAELLANEETLEAVDAALGAAGLQNFDPPAAVETLTRERDAAVNGERSVRAFLVEQGMLAEGDTTTPIVPLLRVLLA